MEKKQQRARLLLAALATSSASSAICSWLSSAERVEFTVADFDNELAAPMPLPKFDLEFKELPEAP